MTDYPHVYIIYVLNNLLLSIYLNLSIN